ncbi:MAG TPA: hypothetical protein VGH73_20910 [Thermoanaerobaculia bacterium]
MSDGLLLGWILIAWGAQATVPWRLAELAPERRRRCAFALLPLLVTGALAAFAHVQAHPDAALSQGIYPLADSTPGRALAVLFPALVLADALAAAGWRGLERAGWRIAAGIGLAFLLAAGWTAELVRAGEGPESAPAALAVLIGLRTLMALGAAEALAPGRPLLAVAAGLALPLHRLLLPAALAHALGSRGRWITLAAAALLFLAARWLPARLRRPALVAAALLAGLYLGEATRLSQELASPGLPPMPSLPAAR